jgi:hypothetical protein
MQGRFCSSGQPPEASNLLVKAVVAQSRLTCCLRSRDAGQPALAAARLLMTWNMWLRRRSHMADLQTSVKLTDVNVDFMQAQKDACPAEFDVLGSTSNKPLFMKEQDPALPCASLTSC